MRAAVQNDTRDVQPKSPAPGAELGHRLQIWGGSIRDGHDLAWASFGVEVIRPGVPRFHRRGQPALYMLLEQNRLVWFDLKRAIKRMHWLDAGVLRVRLSEQRSDHYDEHIRTDERGDFLRFERRYGATDTGTCRIWLTASAHIAERWATQADVGATLGGFRREIDGNTRLVSISVGGTIASSAHDETAEHWADEVLRSWDRVSAVFESVYEYQPGVWSDETAVIAPDATLVGPLWIGRGASIGPREVVIGPRVVPDRRDLPTVSRTDHEIEWPEMMSRHWSLPAITGRTVAGGVLKRTFDVVFSLIVLAFTLPVYPLVMLAIYIEDGRPFFFAHRRQTRNGREFPCLKFRTMVRDAEARKDSIRHLNRADGPQFFTRTTHVSCASVATCAGGRSTSCRSSSTCL